MYDVKDLLRGSIITNSPENTYEVVQALFKLDKAKVVELKNGFVPKDGEVFDPTK